MHHPTLALTPIPQLGYSWCMVVKAPTRGFSVPPQPGFPSWHGLISTLSLAPTCAQLGQYIHPHLSQAGGGGGAV